MMVVQHRQFDEGLLKTIMNWRTSIFIGACLICGGTSQSIVIPKTLLYVASLFMIGSVLCEPRRLPLKKLVHTPIVLGLLFVLAFILYLVPMPPALWGHLPGREGVVRGYELVEMELPWLPLTLTPEKTFFALFDFLPVIAIVLVLKLSAGVEEIKKSLYTVVLIAAVSSILGVGQAISNLNMLYPYQITNFGSATGFFSNANHQACFLTMAFPLAAFFAAREWQGIDGQIGKRIAWGGASLSIILGLYFTQSMAGYVLFLYVSVSITLILSRRSSFRRVALMLFIGLVLFIAIYGLFLQGEIANLTNKLLNESDTSRRTVFRTTLPAIKDYGIFGTGPGSFEEVYRLYENRQTIRSSFVPHAHNDFLQLSLEMGIIGIVLFLYTLVWYVIRIAKLLSDMRQVRSMSLLFAVIALVPVFHSLVDYPLRTISLSVLFVFFLLLCSDGKTTVTNLP